MGRVHKGDNIMDNGQIDFTNLSAKKCLRILLEHPDQADKCDWKEMRRQLDGLDWVWLLSAHPQFADRCLWASLDGYCWARVEGSPKGIFYGVESVIRFDLKDDSTWTASLDFYVQDCRSGICSDSLPRIHITGRFRYWIPADER